MELTLTGKEVQVLKDLLEGDYALIIREIARTDARKMRDELKARETLIRGIMEKLGMVVRPAA